MFMVRRHVADLGLLQKTNWRRGAPGTNGRRHTPGGSACLVSFASSRARGDASGAAEFLWGGGLSRAVAVSCRDERFIYRARSGAEP